MRYGAKLLDHFENPRNVGSLDEADASVGTAVITAGECGDVTKLQLRIDATGRIAEARFKTFGCGAAIAAGSYATEWLTGKTVAEALAIEDARIAEELELGPQKLHCSAMTQQAVRAAIDDWRGKNKA